MAICMYSWPQSNRYFDNKALYTVSICNHNLANIRDLLLSTSDRYHIGFGDNGICLSDFWSGLYSTRY